jgi:hypothetical protein
LVTPLAGPSSTHDKGYGVLRHDPAEELFERIGEIGHGLSVDDVLWYLQGFVLTKAEWSAFERIALERMSYRVAARELGRDVSGVRRRYLRAIEKAHAGIRFPRLVHVRVEWRRADPRAERRFRIMCGEDGEPVA